MAERPAGDGDHLQQPPRLLGQAEDPGPEHVVEVDPRGCPRSPQEVFAGLHVPHQLGHEERVAARLPRDLLGQCQAAGPAFPIKRHGEFARLGWRQRLDSQLSPLDRGVGSAAGSPSARTNGLRLRVLAPVARHEQQHRGIRRPEDLRQERGAVEVAPLNVVDARRRGDCRSPSGPAGPAGPRTLGAATPAGRGPRPRGGVPRRPPRRGSRAGNTRASAATSRGRRARTSAGGKLDR